MTFFLGEGVLALTSDASIDFAPDDFDMPLSMAQQAYLKEISGRDIRQVFWRKQIHGDDVLTAAVGVKSARGCPDADAFVTNEKNLALAIRTADCVPVFLYDPIHQAVGLAHAGWRGTQKRIAVKTFEKMRENFGTHCPDLKIALGPSIRPCCYQVGKEFRDYFPGHVQERGGQFYMDMMGANHQQLMGAGALETNIYENGVCTCCDRNYFSFRRDGSKAGRMISLIMLMSGTVSLR